jgi:hypothetical protein
MKNIRVAVAGALVCLGAGGVALAATVDQSPPSAPPEAEVLQDGQTVAEGKTPGGKKFTIKALDDAEYGECLVLADKDGPRAEGCGRGLNGQKMVVQATLIDDEVIVYPLVDQTVDKIVVRSKKAKLGSARKRRAASARKMAGKPHKIAATAVPAAPAGFGGIQVTALDSAGNVVATDTIPDPPGGPPHP